MKKAVNYSRMEKKMKKSYIKDFYTDNVKFVSINNNELVMEYSNLDNEYQSLRNDTAIIDGFGYEIIKVSGNDAESFLNKHITKDIAFLNEGSIVECMIIDDNATVLAFTFACKFENHYLLIIPPEKRIDIFPYLSNHVEDNTDITFSVVDEKLIFIEGPKSWLVARDIFNVEVDTVALRTIIETTINGQPITIARIGRSGEYGYAILASESIIINLIKECLNNKMNLSCELCGLKALYLCMLEIHQPNIFFENPDKWNLFELGYQWFIQYDKTEYTGFESLMELFNKGQDKLSVGFIVKDTTESFNEEAKIYLYDECVGTVLYSIYNPINKCVIGVAMLDKKVAVSGIELVLKNNANQYIIKTLSSPYVRPLSWDEKME